MTVSTQTLKRTYLADGVQRTWPVDFPLREMADLELFVTDTDNQTRQITENATVSESGHYVVYPSDASGLDPLPAGTRVTLVRNTPRTQEIDLVRQGQWDAQVLEEGLDKLTLLVQELDDKVNRSVIFLPTNEEPLLPAESWVEKFDQTAQHTAQAASSAQSAAQYAQNAAQSEQNTEQAATVAYAAASSAQESKTLALEAATQASGALLDIKNRQTSSVCLIAGTAEDGYDGSLTRFPTTRQLTDLSVDVYVNGVRKHDQKPQEFSLQGSEVVFSEPLTAGDSVVILVNGRLSSGVDPASTSAYGLVQLATAYDALTGTDNQKAITPYALQQKINETESDFQSVLQQTLATETQRAQTQETQLAQSVSAEQTRATAAENALENACFTRGFTPLNVVVAHGVAGIAGTYTLADLPNDNKVRLALFECTLQLSSSVANYSSMALASDVATQPAIVCGTNNSFRTSACVWLPIKKQVSISFPALAGGVENGTQLRLLGYL